MKKLDGRKLDASDPSKLASQDTAHYNAILIEDMRSQMKLFTELVMTSIDGLRGSFDAFRVETNQRFDTIEMVLKDHSQSIQELKTDVAGLKTDGISLKAEVSAMRSDMVAMEFRLSKKIDGNTSRLDDHEARIGVLESSRPS